MDYNTSSAQVVLPPRYADELYAAEIRERASTIPSVHGLSPAEARAYRDCCFLAATQLEQAGSMLRKGAGAAQPCLVTRLSGTYLEPALVGCGLGALLLLVYLLLR